MNVTVQCDSNPIPFYDVTTDVQVMGQVPLQARKLAVNAPTSYTYTSQIGQVQDWQDKSLLYNQKFMMDDTITIMMHTSVSDPYNPATDNPKLYLCDANGKVLTAYTTALASAPIYKGYQFIAGNNYLSDSGSVTPLVTSLWMFSFTDLGITIGGIYYLKLVTFTNPATIAQVLYSEPILVSNMALETRLFEYKYNSNSAINNFVLGGWYDDYPTNTMPTQVYFNLRVEAFKTALDSKALLIGYKQQSYNPVQINTILKRAWTLHIGDISLGVPEYMIEKVGYAITADKWIFDGYGYILPFDGSSTQLTDLFKIQETDVNPLRTATVPIQEQSDSQRALGNGRETITGHIFTSVFSDVFA